MKNKPNHKIISLSLLLVVLLTSGFGLKQCQHEVQSIAPQITLNYWGVWDNSDAFSGVIAAYRAQHPNIKINYRKLTYNEYENALLEAFATDRGPDVFSIHNTWTRKYQGKGLIKPLPPRITISVPSIQGKLKKEIVWQKQTKAPSVSPTKIKDDFVDVVYGDVVIKTKNDKTGVMENKIYGLPLSVDTLAMYYNKDLFNNAGITTPPAYWNTEFQQNVKKLTKQNSQGQIIQSAVALGGSDNVERSTDILSALMMQNGTEMMAGNQVRFNVKPDGYPGKVNPGEDALRFYTDFANPAKEVYCWNDSLDNSLDLFIQGKLAIMFGYAYMLPQIRAEAPKMNFSISPLPQIEDNTNVNFANYWVEAVASKTKYPNEAWDFLQFISSANNVGLYLDKAKKPTALRSLIDKQKEDPDIGIFVDQALTAKSWYKGADAGAAEKIMRDMIKQAVSGRTDLGNIINLGAQKVQQTIKGD